MSWAMEENPQFLRLPKKIPVYEVAFCQKAATFGSRKITEPLPVSRTVTGTFEHARNAHDDPQSIEAVPFPYASLEKMPGEAGHSRSMTGG